MRVAAIDCGTNSIRLLIADADAAGRLSDVVREMRIVRLGEGVDKTGSLASEAIERTRVAVAEYAALIAAHQAGPVRLVATSATRDASNRVEFASMVRAELGVEPQVVTGQEEAALSFTGALSGLPGVRGPMLVADIGGGSTEVVLGDGSAGRLRSHSMDIGCVRMTERHLHDDPPTAAQVALAVSDIRSAIALAGHDVPIRSASAFVGVAGTVTTLAAITLGLSRYDPTAIHGSVLSVEQIHAVTSRLLGMGHAERAALPVMHPGRVDVIVGGALILRTLVEQTGMAEVVVSEHDILDGIALSLR